MAESKAEQLVAAVRRFNRFYTKRIGLLRQDFLESPFTLTEGRVLYELAHQDKVTASGLGRELGLDPGYLSRLLQGFEKGRLIARARSKTDGRQSLLSLTRRGQDAFAPLHTRSREQIGTMLAGLSVADQDRLVGAMQTIEELLGARPEVKAPYMLRPQRPGDMGWVVHRHGALYAQEYGWDETFEALVAEVVANFIRHFDPKRERCWMAEKDGEIVGSVFLVKRSKTVAQLRLLLVEPRARGLGIGARLCAECVRLARELGYKKITLWTNSVLVAARRIYEAAGFRLVRKAPHRSFGHDLVGEIWELRL